MRKRFDERYVKIGVTIFAAGAALILFNIVLGHLPDLSAGVGRLFGILEPFIYGFIIAYLLCPIYNLITRRCYHNLSDKVPKKKAFWAAKFTATVLSLGMLFLVVTAVSMLMIPQMIESIGSLIQTTPSRIKDLTTWIQDTMGDSRNPVLADMLSKGVNNAYDYVFEFIKEKIVPSVDNYIEMVSQGVWVTVRTVFNLIIGIIVSVYLLNGKERFKAQGKKTVTALCSRSRASEIFEFGNFVNRTFGGFINGKIIDSIIIGFICFFLMSILHLPYAALCATIIGVTNFIPFFGPFIGAVPTSLIICVASPLQALEFLVMVFALQQFDGYFLGPKILGESTGLASFWVMLAIVLFGGLFGFVGMIIGVPTFAIFYYYGKRFIEKRLQRKQLSVATEEYQDFNKYDINRKDVL